MSGRPQKYSVGEIVTGNYTIMEIGRWGNHTSYLCQHTCGRQRKFEAYQLYREKQPCKLCMAGKLRMKESDAIICNSEYRKYKSSAKKRGLEFSLTLEQFSDIVRTECVYCGRPPHDVKSLPYKRNADGRVKSAVFGGVDRLHNDFGYVWENCVPACWDCNRSKNTFTVDEWIDMINRWNDNLYKFKQHHALKYGARV